MLNVSCNLVKSYTTPRHLIDDCKTFDRVSHLKTRVPELLCGIVPVILSLTTLAQYRLVTGRWTNGQTDRHDHSIYCTSVASAGNTSSSAVADKPMRRAASRQTAKF